MKSNTVIFLMAITSALLFTGCGVTITNLTPSKLNENPSSIYTFSAALKLPGTNIVDDSLEATLVINQQRYPMQRRSADSMIFSYDFPLPANQVEARFFYEFDYQYRSNEGNIVDRTLTSELFSTSLVNRYTIQMEATRGPVGSRIGLVGRGFSRFDVITFDGLEIETDYASANALSFRVPPVEAARSYNVALRTGQGDIPAGQFRVDASRLSVLPDRLELGPDGSAMLIFSIDVDAPPQGLFVDVTTDIPDSVIMPEVMIQPGARSVNVPVQAGDPGTGTLFIQAAGYDTVSIPLKVR